MDPLRVRQLDPSFDGYGLVIDFLARQAVFAAFSFGPFSRAVRAQLARRHHVCALRGDRLAGYLGWLPTTREIGAAWLRDSGRLITPRNVPTDAVALTVVAIDAPDVLRPLIRESRRLNPDRRVFFKRHYAAPERPPRKATVHNVTG